MDNSNTKGKISIADNVSSDINLMLEQIKYLHNELNSIQSSFLTLISISLGAYGLVIFYALNYGSKSPESVNYLFIVLPFLFFLSFYNIIKYTIKMLGIGAYIKYLEKKINKEKSKAIFMWGSYLISSNSFGLIGGIAQIPCYAAVVIFLFYMFFENVFKKGVPLWCSYTLTTLLIVQAIVLFLMLIKCLYHGFSVEYWCDKISKNYSIDIEFKTRAPFWYIKLKDKFKKEVDCDDGEVDCDDGDNDPKKKITIFVDFDMQ